MMPKSMAVHPNSFISIVLLISVHELMMTVMSATMAISGVGATWIMLICVRAINVGVGIRVNIRARGAHRIVRVRVATRRIRVWVKVIRRMGAGETSGARVGGGGGGRIGIRVMRSS